MTNEPISAAVPDGGPSVKTTAYSHPDAKFKYEVVQGYFVQSGPEPKHIEFEDLLDKSFGLIDTSENRWFNLRESVKKLQREAEEDEQIKVIFCGRHGEGWHNVARAKYVVDDEVDPVLASSTALEWDYKWALLTGDEELTWGPDPFLTPLGESQAVNIGSAWAREQAAGAPIGLDEMKWYTSPFTRAVQTLERSWKGLRPERVEAWEDLREIYGLHTCDQRLTKTGISERFPWLDFETGFTEADELWKADERETDAHMQERMQRVMDRIFAAGAGGTPETYVSLTAHSAILRNLMVVLNHQPYPQSTGEMIPIVVRATRI